MRKTALAGLFAIALLAVNTHHTSAQSLEILQVNSHSDISIAEPLHLATINVVSNVPTEPAQPSAPQPQTYTVAENDSLTKIAQHHDTTWKRLYDKNTNVDNPDVLKVGIELAIPSPDEQLADRPLPQKPVATPAATLKPQSRQAVSRGSISGNSYTPGYCTWYAKNKRPDLPNNLGDAATWVSRARAQGIPTGSTPQVGAIGQAGNHVVYVESVNGDGTVTISEMNHAGVYVVTTRTVSASYFSYIY